MSIDINSKAFASVYDELPFWSAPFGFELLKHLRLKKDLQALDIGSGSGFPLIELAERIGISGFVTGIDPWESVVERVKQKLKIYEVKNAAILKQNAEGLQFEDDFFDLIISNNGLNNVQNIDKVLEECHRTSKKGAQLLFSANLPETMLEFYDVMKQTVERLGVGGKLGEGVEEKIKQHIWSKRKSVEETVEIVERNNFRVMGVYENTFSYRFVDGSSMLNHHFIKLAFLPAWKELIPAKHRKTVFHEIENKLNTRAANKGEIQLIVPFACYDCLNR